MSRWTAGLCAVIATFALAACGSDDDGGSTTASTTTAAGGGSGELTQVSAAVAQTIDSIAAFQAAQEQGYFEQNGLEVKGNVMPYGPGVLASAVSGENQFAFAVVSDAIQAAAGGLPITMVAPGGTTNPGRGTVDALVVKRGEITDAKELEGKTVAVPVLKSLPVLQVEGAMRELGADPSKVEFVALDFPSMLPALKSGKIAGAFLVEPFITISGAAQPKSPFEILYDNPDATVVPEGSTVSAWFTTKQYAGEHPETVDAFGAAISEAQTWLAENPKEMRRITAEALKLPPELAKAIAVGVPGSEINVESVQVTADKMVEGGLIEEAPQMSDFVHGAEDGS